MRDPARINRILELIKEVWNKHSDSRFGQLLINNGLITDTMESWSIEDDDVETQLKYILEQSKKQ